MNIALRAGHFVCVLPPLHPQLLDQIQYERCRGGGEEVPGEREALWVVKRMSRDQSGPLPQASQPILYLTNDEAPSHSSCLLGRHQGLQMNSWRWA